MTDDIHTPEILATVGHFDYIIGVLKRPRDGGAAHFYSSIEEWETTEAYQAAALQRRLDDMGRDRDAAEKKVGELILRNQAQEGTIDRLQRQLLEAQAARAATPAEAPLPALPATDPPEREESRARGRSAGHTRADLYRRSCFARAPAPSEDPVRRGRLPHPDGGRRANGRASDAQA